MLFSLVIIQTLITLILTQTYQAVLSQLQVESHYLLPHPTQEIQRCLNGMCSEKVTHFSLHALSTSGDRQFFNAMITHCENENCYQISQIFSERSAILKGERRFHAATVRHN